VNYTVAKNIYFIEAYGRAKREKTKKSIDRVVPDYLNPYAKSKNRKMDALVIIAPEYQARRLRDRPATGQPLCG
jgi:hypothetical protein